MSIKFQTATEKIHWIVLHTREQFFVDFSFNSDTIGARIKRSMVIKLNESLRKKQSLSMCICLCLCMYYMFPYNYSIFAFPKEWYNDVFEIKDKNQIHQFFFFTTIVFSMENFSTFIPTHTHIIHKSELQIHKICIYFICEKIKSMPYNVHMHIYDVWSFSISESMEMLSIDLNMVNL